jgi:hypothetical protein
MKKYKCKLNTQNKKNLLFLNMMDDTCKNTEITKTENDNLDSITYIVFNSGGTVKALYNAYKYLEGMNYEYMGCWEDDTIFQDDFLDKVSVYLKNDYDMVGSLWTCEDGYDNEEVKTRGVKLGKYMKLERLVPHLRYKHILENNNSNELIPIDMYIWFDGSCYITTQDKLNRIYDKLSVFTLAPSDERYNYIEHGINYGEVGFPTRMCYHGFNIFGIDRKSLLNVLNTKDYTVKYQ